MREIKVLHIITGLSGGGAENVLLKICCGTENVKHAVINLGKNSIISRILEENNIKVLDLNINPLNIFAAITKYIKFSLSFNPDVTQAWMYHACLFSLLESWMGRCVIWNIRRSDYRFSSVKLNTYLIITIIKLFSYSAPHKIVYCSKRGLEYHAKSGFKNSIGIHIPNGCDTKIFKPENRVEIYESDESGRLTRQFTLGTAARFHSDKGHSVLLEALGMLKNKGITFKCKLAGTGIDSNNSNLIELIDRHNLTKNVTLHGPVLNVAEFLKELDIHILPSITEGFPNILIEAMACGVTCIAADVGDCKHILGDKNLTFSKGDSCSLEKTIRDVMELPQKTRRSISYNLVERVRRYYTLSNMCIQYVNLWMDCHGQNALRK
jgi:glycosyltransferase involved in cell wall biosynthesis